MDTDAPGTESNATEEADPGKLGRPHPIVFTSATNLIQIKTVIIASFATTYLRVYITQATSLHVSALKSHQVSTNIKY
jgi:hypothetical protein